MATFVKKFKAWFVRVLNSFNLYTHDQVEEKLLLIKDFGEKLITSKNENGTLRDARNSLYEDYKALAAEKEELEKRVAELDEMCQYWKNWADEYRQAPVKNEEYVKAVQKQLSELLGSSEAFGFPNTIPIPGSTSMGAEFVRDQNDVGHVVVRSRVIFPDNVTAQLNATQSMRERMDIVMDHMSRYGAFERLVRFLVSYGGMSFTLGYNSDCTTYEVFVETAAKVYSDDALFVIANKVPDTEIKL